LKVKRSRKRILTAMTASTVGLGTIAATGPVPTAAAGSTQAPEAPPSSPASEEFLSPAELIALVDGPGDAVVTEYFTIDGVPIAEPVVTYGSEGTIPWDPPAEARVRSNGSGNSGSSTASGCRKQNLRNEFPTVLGGIAYEYWTWTYWCWDRSDRVVDDVSTGQFFEDVDPFFAYKKMTLRDETHYSWVSGYNKSGFKHVRQAHWENCVPLQAFCANSYPKNSIYSHSDGTAYYSTTS
jgi:hypothetical protein